MLVNRFRLNRFLPPPSLLTLWWWWWWCPFLHLRMGMGSRTEQSEMRRSMTSQKKKEKEEEEEGKGDGSISIRLWGSGVRLSSELCLSLRRRQWWGGKTNEFIFPYRQTQWNHESENNPMEHVLWAGYIFSFFSPHDCERERRNNKTRALHPHLEMKMGDSLLTRFHMEIITVLLARESCRLFSHFPLLSLPYSLSSPLRDKWLNWCGFRGYCQTERQIKPLTALQANKTAVSADSWSQSWQPWVW